MLRNPFITYGYEGPDYFCDRVAETKQLTDYLVNGNNVLLISPRRMGKTGLIRHCFNQKPLSEEYNTFLIDIYSTNSLKDLVSAMGKTILSELMPKGERALSKFVKTVSSLRPVMSIDTAGNPSWSIDFSGSIEPVYSLEEIFKYLEESDKPNIVAIDEFQQITSYPEKNVEAVLRTLIQHSSNTTWLFSGSSRHILSEMFASPARPFYASVSTMALDRLPCNAYADFCQNMFSLYGKQLDREVAVNVYDRFDGTTWFMQRLMNKLFSDTPKNDVCRIDMVEEEISSIVNESRVTYEDLLYQLTSRQKELLLAINKEKKASAITGGKFIKKHGLQSPSTVQTSIKALVDKQLVTLNKGEYEVYDKFLSIWLDTV